MLIQSKLGPFQLLTLHRQHCMKCADLAAACTAGAVPAAKDAARAVHAAAGEVPALQPPRPDWALQPDPHLGGERLPCSTMHLTGMIWECRS